MIDRIKQYLMENRGKLSLNSSDLEPLQLFNVNYNFVESYPIISRVVLWFEPGNSRPSIATKITDAGLTKNDIEYCTEFQTEINRHLGRDVFLKVLDVFELEGSLVIAEEAEANHTYETELKFAICGPERCHARFERTFTSQMSELGELTAQLNAMDRGGPLQKWGDKAFEFASRFKNENGFTEADFPEHGLQFMREAINKLEIRNTPVLADFVCPNIFPGPRLIDNVHPELKVWNTELPGIINIFRFIVPYFYSPPVNLLYPDWSHALASALADEREESIIGGPLRELLRKNGLDPVQQADSIWALIQYAAVFEMQDKLLFYQNSPFMLGGKIQTFKEWIQRMCEVSTIEVNADYLLDCEKNLHNQI